MYAETGTFRERIFKNFVCGNRLRGRKNGSISVSKFRKRRRHYFRQINNSWCVYSWSTSFEDCEKFWRVAAVWIVGHFYRLIYNRYRVRHGVAAYKSFDDYRPFDDRWLRIVTIRSLATLHVKSNAEKGNYQSDPDAVFVFVSLFFI